MPKTEQRKDSKNIQYRDFAIPSGAIDKKKRTVALAFSSEKPVLRWEYETGDYYEILDHSPESVDLGRLRNKAAVLKDHDRYNQVGVVESASIDADRIGRAVIRFGKNGSAVEEFDDLVDGIRTKISFGYFVNEKKPTGDTIDGIPVFRSLSWTPYEISSVSIPADDDVGVGRAAEKPIEPITEERQMPATENQPAATEQTAAPAAPAFDVKAERESIRAEERKRSNEIRDLGKRRNMESAADQFIDEGKTVEQFRAYVLDSLDDGSQEPAAPQRHASVDMTTAEHDQYSVVRAIRAASTGDWSNAGLEREVHQDIEKQLGRESEGVLVPTNLRASGDLYQRMQEMQQRAPLLTTPDAQGGYTVQTNVMSLIELLRNRMLVRRMGARVLSGLNGDVSFPTQATGSAFTWVAQNPGSDVSDSDATIGNVSLTPKAGQSSTSYSRQLLAQSSLDIEAFVRDDLTLAAAIGIDNAAINGTGASNQPTGIRNTTGIGSVVGGTNGLAPTFAHMVDLETEVSTDNADLGALGYLTNAKVRGKLKTTEKASSTGQFVWGDGNEPGFGMVNGYRAGVSNQVPSDLTKGTSSGVCSSIIYGNWNDLLIGEWGAMEILVDPYRLKKQGMIEVTSFCMADIAVRHAESFSVMDDALTA